MCMNSRKICSPYTRTQLKTLALYEGFDRNVLLENDVHKIRYDQTILRN